MGDDVRVNRNLTIPDNEIKFRFTTSSGPGGQHVNKASTRAELLWDVAGSSVLGPRQRERIRGHLRNRIDSSGVLHLASARHRSQLRNRHEVLAQLARLVAEALVPQKKRRPTEPTRSSKEQRLRAKKRRSQVKQLRAKPSDE